jgi:hypothetical protein
MSNLGPQFDKAQRPTAREIAERLSTTMQCRCDLDNWQPENSTGHSWVCQIHKAAMAEWSKQPKLP